MDAKLTIEKPTATPKGLHDRGQVTLTCESCERPLLVVQITANTADLQKAKIPKTVSRIRACCGSCGGSSTIADIEGLFHAGSPNDDTTIEPQDPDDDGVVLFVSRSK